MNRGFKLQDPFLIYYKSLFQVSNIKSFRLFSITWYMLQDYHSSLYMPGHHLSNDSIIFSQSCQRKEKKKTKEKKKNVKIVKESIKVIRANTSGLSPILKWIKDLQRSRIKIRHTNIKIKFNVYFFLINNYFVSLDPSVFADQGFLFLISLVM